jgi:YVTN family beta-propeller protein
MEGIDLYPHIILWLRKKKHPNLKESIMLKKSFILILLLYFVACQAQEPNTILNTPGLEGGLPDSSGVAILPNGQFAYVLCTVPLAGATYMNVIDIATNTIVATLEIAVAYAIAITPNGQYAYVGSAPVQIINLENLTIFGTVPGTDAKSGIGTIAITPNGQYAYIINEVDAPANNYVSVIDLRPSSGTYNMVIANIPIGSSDGTIAITPDGDHVYATSPDNNTVYVISTATNTISATITTIIAPYYVAITPNNQYAYITDFGDNNIVSVVDIVNNTVVDTISIVEDTAIAITPNGAYAYVTSVHLPDGLSSVAVIDLATNTVLSTPALINAFRVPAEMAVTPNNAFVYVANGANSDDVLVIYTGLSGAAPVNFSGCKRKNIFLTQTDNYNHLTWFAPTIGSPVAYNIYRDAGLTQLIAAVPASGILQYDDHNRNPNINYTYYIVAVDGFGNVSAPAVTTVTRSC